MSFTMPSYIDIVTNSKIHKRRKNSPFMNLAYK